MAKALRILYAAGPGNVLGTYLYWKEGHDDPTQIAITYSGQFYDVCRELDSQAYVIATCRQAGKHKDGNFHIVHRPIPFEDSSGFLYHLGQFWYGLRLLFSALRIGANVAVICAGTHWFFLYLLTMFGIKVVPTLHCVLHKKYKWKPTLFQRIIQKLNGWFFASNGCAAIITVSEEISQQVIELTHGQSRPIFQFVPQYRRSSFAKIAPPRIDDRPFRILYVGRIERNKGVFDVLTIAQRLVADGRTDFVFDLCGAGSALLELRKAIDTAGMGERVLCHGHCDQETMQRMYSQSHVVIVPTTSDFSEGFNKVVAEGVLSGRPVITSSVCPALSVVRDSVVEVPPDDVPAYTDAIIRLWDNNDFYLDKVAASRTAQAQFYDPERGWAAALKHIFASMDGRSTEPVRQWLPDPKPLSKLN